MLNNCVVEPRLEFSHYEYTMAVLLDYLRLSEPV